MNDKCDQILYLVKVEATLYAFIVF